MDGMANAKSMKEAMKTARYCMNEPSWNMLIGKVQVLIHRVEKGLHLYVLAGSAELIRKAPGGEVKEYSYPK